MDLKKYKEVKMKLKLIKASEEYKDQISDMLEEWYATGEKIIGGGGRAPAKILD